MKAESLRVLIVSRWEEVVAIARLPRALKQAGFTVGALCTPESFLAQTRYLDARFTCPRRHHRLLDTFVGAVRSWKPDLLIPGNDWDLEFLHRVARSPFVRHESGPLHDLVPLLDLSLGNPAMFDTIASKSGLQQIAASLGIRTPLDQVISTPELAFAYADAYGYPVVLKRDNDSGGSGVWICQDESSLQEATRFAFGPRSARPRRWTPRQALKRLVQNALLVPRPPGAPTVSVQRFVSGRSIVHNFAAHEGEIVSAVTVESVCKHPLPTGPCSVVRPIRNRYIKKAAAVLVDVLQFSGFGCFDFIVDEQSGDTTFIEFNPIPTNVAHLGDRLGSDLCAGMHARLSGHAHRADTIGSNEPARVIALFPQELRRDPRSPHLTRGFHDVPTDDPDLLRALASHYRLPLRATPGEAHPRVAWARGTAP